MSKFVTFKGRVPINLDKVTYIYPIPTSLKVAFIFDSMNNECMNEMDWVLDNEEDYNYVLDKLNIEEL